MSEFTSITLNKYSTVPLYRQLGDAFYKFILNGALTANRKLPPIRTLAQGLRINNDTVINAYKYLENLGVVYSVGGSGTYVAEISQVEIKPYIFPIEAVRKFFLCNVQTTDLSLVSIFGFFCGENRT